MDDDFISGDVELSASDGEEDHIKANKKHAKLLDSISALDGVRRSKLSERTVLADTISEFGFNQSRAERKVRLHELVGTLQNTTSHGELKKQLRTVNKRTQVASVPLSKFEEAKIQRTTAYEKTKEDVSKWNSVVAENRKAEQISFPLQQPSLKLQTADEVKSRFKPRTPLEIEIAALLQKSADTVGTHDAELTPAEERALKAMSLAEARERRAELQKYRALLTYKQARAKREKKIKSKKYHRILKKERQKKEKAMMDELQRTDPEAFAEKIEEMERARVKERMTLKHRGGSKFALRQKLYGKYDSRSRDAVQNMLQTHKELTKKAKVIDDEDSESGVSLPSDDEDIPTQLVMTRADNPWMKAKAVSEFQRPQAVQNVEKEENEDEEDDDDDEDDEAEEEEEEGIIEMEDKEESKDDDGDEKDDDEEEDADDDEEDDDDEDSNEDDEVTFKMNKSSADEDEETEEEIVMSSNKKKQKAKATAKEIIHDTPSKKTQKMNKKARQNDKDSKGKIVEDVSIDTLFQNLSYTRLERAKRFADNDTQQKESKSSRRKRNKKKGRTNSANRKQTDSDSEEEEMIDVSLMRKRTLEDMEGGFESSGKTKKKSKQKSSAIKTKTDTKTGTKTEDIYVDPKKLFALTTQLKNSASVDIVTDGDGNVDEDDKQRLTIAQAFAEDDVVDEFSKEKSDVVERDRPKDIDLTLPGWGDWGGAGVKPSKKKRKRFTLKAPDTGPRRDRGLGHVIISEKVEDAVATHQVSRLPFPYTSADQFEQSIRAPIGKNWNPETAFRKLIKPKVVTKLGKIIAPIDKSDVFKNKKNKTDEDSKVSGGPSQGEKLKKRQGKKK